MKLLRPHHQQICDVLGAFDAEYLSDHKILFGGGTRIAMEIKEYRESVDIDFLCADSQAYKAVRSQVKSNSLGLIVKPGRSLEFLRDIRADRDAVRAFLKSEGRPIKLEFIFFDNYHLGAQAESLFPVPCIDRASCFLTKLLANADRHSDRDKKDIFDLCVMHHFWGGIPEKAWQFADQKYGMDIVLQGLQKALEEMLSDKQRFMLHAQNALLVKPEMAEAIVGSYASALLQDVQRSFPQLT